MMSIGRPHVVVGVLMVAQACCTAVQPQANPTPDEHRAKYHYTRVQPLFDTPLRDTAIARGPDGTYYLTGTTGTERPDGTVNFAINEGIRLWRSKDLKTWDDLGLVAPLSAIA